MGVEDALSTNNCQHNLYTPDSISNIYAALLSAKLFSTIPYDSLTLCSYSPPYHRFISRSRSSDHHQLSQHSTTSPRPKPAYLRCLATRCRRRLPYKRFRNVSGVRVFWEPRYARIPQTVMLLSPSSLRLSPLELWQTVASIVPPETVRVSRVECKLDFEGIRSADLYLATSVRSARKARRYKDTQTFYFNRRRTHASYTIYDKAQHLGIEGKEITRIEARLKLCKRERPLLIEFLSGVTRPKDPFSKVMIANPAGLSRLDGRTRNSILRHQSIHNGLKEYAKTHTRRQVDKIRKTVFSSSISLDFLWEPLARAWHREFVRVRRYTQPNKPLPSPGKSRTRFPVPNEPVHKEEGMVWLTKRKDLRREPA